MKINVRGKNIEITEALKQHVNKKLGKLSKYFDDEVDTQVSMEVIRDLHKVEVTSMVGGLILRGEEISADMYNSIDRVVDKLERQIAKHKTKINRKFRRQGLDIDIPSSSNEADPEPKIVRTKRFAVKPMTEEEALLQMNMLGHDFFVFRSADNEEICVLYRRKDGNYGLIEPEST